MDEENNGNRFFKWVTVQAYKHDGLLHRQWSPAYLTVENNDYWALSSKASLVTENDGRRWMTKEHAVFILFKHEWMNIICMMKENGGICYYVNVASPTIKDHGFLKYIDYDLDVKLFPDETIKELDEQEFERHVLTYGYSEELTAAIKKSFSSIKKRMQDSLFPFNENDVRTIYQKFLDENHPFVLRTATPNPKNDN
jgi:protein associated with RNAse G/E